MAGLTNTQFAKSTPDAPAMPPPIVKISNL